MSRRKITEEADETVDSTSEGGDNEENQDREQLTQRMPPTLVERVDEFADENGISSRNAAINMLVQQGLTQFESN